MAGRPCPRGVVPVSGPNVQRNGARGPDPDGQVEARRTRPACRHRHLPRGAAAGSRSSGRGTREASRSAWRHGPDNYRGHQADADLAPVDSGDLTFTDKRIVFSGDAQVRGLGILRTSRSRPRRPPALDRRRGSGRDRASGFRYDEGQAEEIRFAIVLGPCPLQRCGRLAARRPSRAARRHRSHTLACGHRYSRFYPRCGSASAPANLAGSAGSRARRSGQLRPA